MMSQRKSKIISRYDYTQTDLSPFVLPFEPDYERFNKDLMLLRKKHAVVKEAETVKTDDIITINVFYKDSGIQRKNLAVKTGKNLFDKEAEEFLIGKKTGYYEVQTKHGTAQIELTGIQRTIYPELTDTLISEWNLKEGKTFAEIKEYYLNVQKEEDTEETVRDVSFYIRNLIRSQCSFQLDSEELEMIKEEAFGVMESIIRMQGYSSDDEGFVKMTGMSKEEFRIYSDEQATEDLKDALLGMSYMEDYHVIIPENAYEQRIAEYISQNGTSDEFARQIISPDRFTRQWAEEYYMELLERYVLEYINESEETTNGN